MKNKKTLFALSSSVGILSFLALTTISCSNHVDNSNINDINNFINKLKPQLKPEKINEKSKTLASWINTEALVKEWFDGLPESNGEIKVEFISALPLATDKSILEIKYRISKENDQKEYLFREAGFKNETVSPPIVPNLSKQTFKDFSTKNSFRIRLQYLKRYPNEPNEGNNVWAEGGTAWSWYYKKKSEYVYDWYLVTNFHVLYKSVSWVNGFTQPPGPSSPMQIDEQKLMNYLKNNNVSTFDPKTTFFNLATYDYGIKNYKSLIYTKDIPGFETENKHENAVTVDMVKQIQVITDYQNKNIELFSKVDQNGDPIYNLDASILKVTLDFSSKPDLLKKEYQRPNLIEQYRSNRDYYLNNKFDPTLKSGVSIAGHPARMRALMPVNVNIDFGLKYESLLVGDTFLNGLYGPFQWSKKYLEVKNSLDNGASGSAVYQLKHDSDPNYQYDWNNFIPVGIYWGGQPVAGIGIEPNNNLWDTSFLPFMWSGKTDKNIDLNYNVYDSFIKNLAIFD